jgi:hypothetical protein
MCRVVCSKIIDHYLQMEHCRQVVSNNRITLKSECILNCITSASINCVSVVLILHYMFNNSFLYMNKHIWSLVVSWIWQCCLASSASVSSLFDINNSMKTASNVCKFVHFRYKQWPKNTCYMASDWPVGIFKLICYGFWLAYWYLQTYLILWYSKKHVKWMKCRMDIVEFKFRGNLDAL